jgi:hypothetical protein
MFGPPHQFEFEQRQPHRAPSLRHPGQFVEVMGEGLSKVMIRSRPASGFVARHSEGASPPLRPTPPLKPKSASRAFIPFAGPILEGGKGSIDPFATRSAYDRSLRIPAEDPRRFGTDSGHLVADPIGHQVRFLTAGRP